MPFNHPFELPPGEPSWKFFIACDDADGESSSFLDAMDALGVDRAADFDAMLTHFSRLAATGRPWEALIQDRKKMHHVGEVNFKDVTGRACSEKVWEFKHADLRILWCYGGPNKIILFGHALAKDQKKIDPADVEIVGNVMQEYVMAYGNGQIKIAGGIDNERAYAGLFPKGPARPQSQKKGKAGNHRR